MFENQLTLPCIYDMSYTHKLGYIWKREDKGKTSRWSYEKHYEIFLKERERCPQPQNCIIKNYTWLKENISVVGPTQKILSMLD